MSVSPHLSILLAMASTEASSLTYSFRIDFSHALQSDFCILWKMLVKNCGNSILLLFTNCGNSIFQMNSIVY